MIPRVTDRGPRPVAAAAEHGSVPASPEADYLTRRRVVDYGRLAAAL